MDWAWIVVAGLFGVVIGWKLSEFWRNKMTQESRPWIEPLACAVEELRKKVYDSNSERMQQNITLGQDIKVLNALYDRLQNTTNQLTQSLRTPTVCGRWGEIQLREVVELAGMSEYCDFEMQVNVQNDNIRLRPDLLVHLPGGRSIVVDAKAPMQAYLSAIEAQNEEEENSKLRDHARHIRNHVSLLAGKSYWDLFSNTPEFVVLFLPGECFFSSAVKVDRDLINDAVRQKVILSSPTTLIALLQAVHYGWRQEKITQNAREISELGQEIYERTLPLLESLQKLGSCLTKSVESFNTVVGSLDSRVLPSLRKLRNLEAISVKDLPEISQVTSIPRSAHREIKKNSDDLFDNGTLSENTKEKK